MRFPLLVAVFSLVVLGAYVSAPRAASGAGARLAPEAPTDTTQWENLLILPDSLTRDELMGVMRGFSGGLGVKCGFCHVREGGAFVFASDANPHKETARGMMRMVRQVNVEILPSIEQSPGHDPVEKEVRESVPDVQVTCWTCHRGETTPEASVPPREDR